LLLLKLEEVALPKADSGETAERIYECPFLLLFSMMKKVTKKSSAIILQRPGPSPACLP
jgi:hypothetical protein